MKKIAQFGLGVVFLLVISCSNSTKNDNTKKLQKEIETISIGCLTPLTGDGATYGKATKRGIELAISELEKSEFYKKNILQVIFEDSKLEAKTAINALEKLVQVDKVPVIIGPFGSSVVLAVSSAANKNKIPIISASATADNIKDAGDFVFRIVSANKEQGTTMADYIVNELNIKDKIAIYSLNNDYGVSLATAFKDRVNQLGGNIVFEDKFDLGSKDFRTALSKIKESNPNFIYLPDHYAEAGRILKQAKELDLGINIGGGDGSYSPELIDIAGEGADGFIITLMGMDNNNEATQIFIKNFKERYGEEPDVYAAYAYDVLFVIAEVIKKLINSSTEINGENIKDELYKTNYKGITGTNSFDEFGEVNKSFVLYKVQNGNFEMINK